MTRTCILFIYSFCCSLLFVSCYKDLGNYDYTEPNQVLFAGIDSSYTVLQGSQLNIVPQLTFTEEGADDSARYTYEWIGMKDAGGTNKRVDLAKTRELHAKAAMEPGGYDAYYRVKDKVTGVQFQKNFRLTVITSVYEGWLVLCEVNQGSRLDMISKLSTGFTVLPDVLAAAGSSLQLKGKPISVAAFSYKSNAEGYGIFISTDVTTDRIHPETFQYQSTYNIKYEMVSTVPDNFTAQNIRGGGARAYMVAGGNAYFHYNALNVYFGLPVNIMKDEVQTFEVSPFIAMNSNAVLYDVKRKRFVRHVNEDGNCTLMPTGTMFDYTTGMDLVFMTFTPFNNGNVYAILHDAPNNKYYMVRFTFGSNIQQVYYEEMTATGIAQAKNFAVHPDLGYVLYTVGGKLYSYDMSLKASKLMLDKGAQEFTCLTFRSSALMAASYDASKPEGQNGIIEQYTVPPVQGNFVLDAKYEGLGKVISMAYRAR